MSTMSTANQETISVRGPSAAATLRSLATSLGLSVSTVSRALSGHPYVKETVRARVRQAAQDAGYRPNQLARGLKAQRTDTVGLLLPDIQNDFYTAAAAVIVRDLVAAGYRVQLGITGDDVAMQTASLDDLGRERAAGVIYVPAERRSAAVARLVEAGVPVVALARRPSDDQVDSVVADDRTGAYAVAAHVLALGHRRVALVCGPRVLPTARGRLTGYQEALVAAGVAEDAPLIRLGPFGRAFGYEAALSLLALPDPPTAIIAASSELLTGVLRAAYGHGIVIPAALSIVGFGDPDWFALAHPPVTTVALPMAEMAAAAAQQLLRRIKEAAQRGKPGALLSPRRPGTHLTFEAPLLVRGTTAPPGGPAPN
ncbi:MAG: LacI family DNA-binding transcriptional regulator [Chloroflexota bacterium]